MRDHVRHTVAAAEARLWEQLASFGAQPGHLVVIGEDQYAERYAQWINENRERNDERS